MFKNIEETFENQSGQKIDSFKKKKVSEEDVKELFQYMKTPEFKQLAKDLDGLFTDKQMEELGLKGDIQDMERGNFDETKVEHARHYLKKQMEKYPDHSELLNTQYGGKSFQDVFDGFVEESKNMKSKK